MAELEAAVTLIASWLDCVHVESAPARIASNLELNAAKSLAASLTAGGPIERVCRHEAAHAVTTHVLDLRVGRTCVRSDGSGVAEYEIDEVTPYTMLASAACDLAGICYELVAGADRTRQFQLAHCHDLLSARLNADACRRLAPTWELSNRAVAIFALAAVQSNWDSIAHLASALRLCRELDGDAVRALCGAAQ